MKDLFINKISLNIQILFLFIGISVIGLVIVLYMKNRRLKQLQSNDNILNKLLQLLNSNKSFEGSLTEFLEIISSEVEAPSYAVYLLDRKNNSYVLKAVRHMVNEGADIAPSYSGLLPYRRETFFLPSTLPLTIKKVKSQIMEEGEVPLCIVSVKGGEAVILAGPVKKLSRRTMKLLDFIGDKSQVIINNLLEQESLKKQVKEVVSSGRAVKNISNVFSDFKSMLNMVTNICIQTIGADGGLFISEGEKGGLALQTVLGLDEQTEKLIAQDFSSLSLLMDMTGDKKLVSLSKKDRDFYKVPPYFIAEEVEMMLFVSLPTEKGKALAMFWYKENTVLKEYQIAALKVMTRRIIDVINNHIKFRELSYSYTDILKMLARLIDNLKPSTVGYSDLMYRYALIICKELKLSREETKDVALAAYLSNIGVIGLSDAILFKKGKYTDIEYENMKLHAEAGASIIEATIGNSEVSSYIRYHHERMDGYGYPEGLKGSDIPLGARIIAVVQTFLAKIIARDYRPSLPFDKALEQLKAAAGSQLDTKVVDALIKWLERKQKENIKSTTSLGPCYEMRCVPENICIGCPAYKVKGKNCWEVEGNLCESHGNKCESCFIRTEYLSRMRKDHEKKN